eukprot:m.834696 g.834696  ORF g.834696 m.834696 type:complete len:358 (+) comp23449_c0_seq2:134-1207(+)
MSDPCEYNRLFVGSLAWATTEEGLRAAFSKFGEVTQAHIVTDRETQRSKGFGFITFANEQDAADAKNAMSDKELDGRPIRIDFATRREGGGGRGGEDRRPRDSYAERQSAYNDRGGGRYADSGDRFSGSSRDRGAPPMPRGGRDYAEPAPPSYRDEPRRGGDRGYVSGGGYASGRDNYSDRAPVGGSRGGGGYDSRGGRPYEERRATSVGRGGYDDRDAGYPYAAGAPGGGSYGRGGDSGYDAGSRGGGGYSDRRPVDDRPPPRGDTRGAYADAPRGDYDSRRGGGYGDRYDDRRGGAPPPAAAPYDDRRGGVSGGGYDDRRGGGYDDRRGGSGYGGGGGGGYPPRDGSYSSGGGRR